MQRARFSAKGQCRAVNRRRPRPSPLTALLLIALAVCAAPAAAGQSPTLRYLGPDGAPLALQSEDAVREFLRTAPILAVEDLSSGITKPRRLTLAQGRVRARAIFKSVDLEREALRLQDGAAYAAFYDRATSEVAAYELAVLLGLHMIPPTVFREIEGEAGTVQLWVEDAMTGSERERQALEPPDTRHWVRQHRAMEFFDGLVHNSDRNGGNWLVDSLWNVWMIDHTRAFQRPRGRNEFSHVQQVPRLLWERFLTVGANEIRARLSPYLDHLQMASLLRRRNDLESHVRELILRRGEGAVLVD